LLKGAPVAVAAVLLGVAAPRADAAKRSFAWLWDTDVVPERTVELEWWATEETGDDGRDAVLTVSTVFGLTDNLEIAVPIEAAWRSGSNQTQFQSYGLELRWRLVTADPAKAPPIVPLIRLAAVRLIQPDVARLDADAVVSFDIARGLRAVIDVDGYVVTVGPPAWYLAGGVGVSYAIFDELRVGAELYGLKTLDNDRFEESWLSLGPNLSYTHGRFWITAALPIGLGHGAPTLLPRIVWATAF